MKIMKRKKLAIVLTVILVLLIIICSVGYYYIGPNTDASGFIVSRVILPSSSTYSSAYLITDNGTLYLISTRPYQWGNMTLNVSGMSFMVDSNTSLNLSIPELEYVIQKTGYKEVSKGGYLVRADKTQLSPAQIEKLKETIHSSGFQWFFHNYKHTFYPGGGFKTTTITVPEYHKRVTAENGIEPSGFKEISDEVFGLINETWSGESLT